MIIDNLIVKVKKINDELTSGKLMQEMVLEFQDTILEANAEIQLFEQGINSKGVSIMDYAPYAESTIKRKKKKGQPYNRVTLRDEGDFQKSFFLEVTDSGFEIKASDFKVEFLTKKYGDAILGLTDENIESLVWDYIYPELLKKIKKELYG